MANTQVEQKGLLHFFKRKFSEQYKFNQQFASGKWECMREIGDLGRYSIIIGYCRYFNKSARILDLGCGEGILLERLPADAFGAYHGIDFSEQAIEKAQSKATNNIQFSTGNLNGLVLKDEYDIIIFNESMNYMHHPATDVPNICKHLAANGNLIVSLFDKDGKESPLWQLLPQHFKQEDRIKLTNAQQHTWTVGLFSHQ